MLLKFLILFSVLMNENILGKLSVENKESKTNNFLINADGTKEVHKLHSYSERISSRNANHHLSPTIINIPPAEDGPRVARYIVRNCGIVIDLLCRIQEWGSLASISSIADIIGYPFADVYSISDGPIGNSSGVPYLYVTPLDLTAQNVENDHRCSLSLTLAESHYCEEHNFDPEDPRCAHVVLSGKIVKVKKGTEDEIFAKNALFSRHPAMQKWPKDHNWFFAKLEIEKICLLDYFGGVKMVDIDQYFHANF